MSCTVSELPSGCRLRGMGAASQNTASSANSGGNGNNSSGGIHVGGLLTTTTTSITRMSTANTTNVLPETSPRPQHSQSSLFKNCLGWCCCCSCSCLAIKNAEENASGIRDPASSDLLLDSEKPPLEEIRAWGKSFDKLMKNTAGRKIFSDFLRSEFSEENILFYLACEELKQESNPDELEKKSQFIYNSFISVVSPREVSLDSRVREIVNRNMKAPTPNMFDEAQIQIYTLMHRDSYPRFLNSQKYKSLAQLDGLSSTGSTADSPT